LKVEAVDGQALTEVAIIALGHAFRARGMHGHLDQLRAFWRAQQGGPKANWDDAFVERWMKLLRVPPYENEMPVQPVGSSCLSCGPQSIFGGKRTTTTFPGGFAFICDGCKAEWLEASVASP
jgi:hypothetical protein